MKHQSVAVSSAAGPSRGQPSTSSHKIGAKNANNGIGGLPGGVVGPEAAGLDPSSPEHFFVTLAAYADALDALPLDLTRSFSDLRELDAVLGSHLNSLTARLNHLTALIEDPDVDQGQRLLALKEVAEEARAYKMGGEDKIRVALNTAETIISHTDYIDALDNQLDRFAEISTLLNPTKHLKLDQYYVPGQLKDRKLITTLDSLTAASGLVGADANGAGGSKKKKVAANVAAATVAGGKSHKAADTASLAGSNAGAGASSSKKRKAVSGATVGGSSAHVSSKVAKTSASGKGDDDVKTAANGSNSHKKKTDSSSHAAGSGSKSSHAANSNTRLPRAAHAHSGYTEDDEEGRKDGAARRAADADESSAASRSRNSRNARTTAAAQRSDDEDEDLDDGDMDEEEDDATARSSNKNRSRAGRGNTSGNSRARAAGANSSNSASRAESPASNAGGAGDDADEARYCFCNNVSYGDMIGCDDDDCEREWFHLGCVGLTKPPQGTWYCEACLERRANNGRGGKGKKGAKSSGGGSKSKVRR